MAYKDEYEVARLYTDGAFRKQVDAEFDGTIALEFHLAPPLLARRDMPPALPRKMTFGPWMMSVFRLLAQLKFLRGTPLDPFGYTAERRMERKLIADYEAMLAEVLGAQRRQSSRSRSASRPFPEKIRGFGHVKARHLTAAKADEAALLEQFRSGKRRCSRPRNSASVELSSLTVFTPGRFHIGGGLSPPR